MAGTSAGGKAAAATNLKVHGPDFYRRIGKQGGSAANAMPKGFASSIVGKDGLTGRERAKVVGTVGGTKSRRRPKNYVPSQAASTLIDEALEDAYNVPPAPKKGWTPRWFK